MPVSVRSCAVWILGGLVAAAPAAAARAASIYTSGHADIAAAYSAVDREFEPHWHAHAGAVIDGVPAATDGEYAPADLVAQTMAQRATPAGGGGLSGLLGVPDGTLVWAMGSTTYQPNLGLGAEELDPSEWTGDVTLRFNPGASILPGAFGLFTTNIAGTNVVDRLFSSVDPGATDFANTLPLSPGGHSHYQWAFTLPGLYRLSFTWEGTHVTDGFTSTSAVFAFQAGAAAVPEIDPSGLAGVLAIVTGGLGLLERRRRVV